MFVRLVKGEDSILGELLGDLLDGREHAKGLEVDGEDVFEFLVVGVSLDEETIGRLECVPGLDSKGMCDVQ